MPTIDFGAITPLTFVPGLKPSCLRFAGTIAGHQARLGARLLAKLYRGRHLRRLNSIRLQGANLTSPLCKVHDSLTERLVLISMVAPA